jgi:hypothetical protein
MEIEELELKALHDDDEYVNPYSMFPDAAKILAPDDVATPATAEMAYVGEEEVVQGMGDDDVESTFGTTLTAPLLAPTTRTGREEDETKVFNAVTPSDPAADEVELVQSVRLLVLVMAKQSARFPFAVMSDPA